MVKLDKTDIQFIKANFENADELLAYTNVNDVLEEINIIMVTKGVDSVDEINEFGREAEKVYDNIYANNP